MMQYYQQIHIAAYFVCLILITSSKTTESIRTDLYNDDEQNQIHTTIGRGRYNKNIKGTSIRVRHRRSRFLKKSSKSSSSSSGGIYFDDDFFLEYNITDFTIPPNATFFPIPFPSSSSSKSKKSKKSGGKKKKKGSKKSSKSNKSKKSSSKKSKKSSKSSKSSSSDDDDDDSDTLLPSFSPSPTPFNSDDDSDTSAPTASIFTTSAPTTTTDDTTATETPTLLIIDDTTTLEPTSNTTIFPTSIESSSKSSKSSKKKKKSKKSKSRSSSSYSKSSKSSKGSKRSSSDRSKSKKKRIDPEIKPTPAPTLYSPTYSPIASTSVPTDQPTPSSAGTEAPTNVPIPTISPAPTTFSTGIPTVATNFTFMPTILNGTSSPTDASMMGETNAPTTLITNNDTSSTSSPTILLNSTSTTAAPTSVGGNSTTDDIDSSTAVPTSLSMNTTTSSTLAPTTAAAPGQTDAPSPTSLTRTSSTSPMVPLAPFTLNYIGIDGNMVTTEFVEEAVQVTLSFINDHFAQTFEEIDATSFEAIQGQNTGVSADFVQIQFMIGARFFDYGGYIPEPEEMDALLVVAFQQPIAETLLILLGNLPAENPYSTTTEVTYQTGGGTPPIRSGLHQRTEEREEGIGMGGIVGVTSAFFLAFLLTGTASAYRLGLLDMFRNEYRKTSPTDNEDHASSTSSVDSPFTDGENSHAEGYRSKIIDEDIEIDFRYPDRREKVPQEDPLFQRPFDVQESHKESV